MDVPAKIIFNDICAYFVKSKTMDFDINCKMLRFQNERLLEKGDISFIRRLQNWDVYARNYGALRNVNILTENEADDAEECKKFLIKAADWVYPIERIQLAGERCILFLKRTTVIETLLRQVLGDSSNSGLLYGKHKKNTLRYVYVHKNPKLIEVASKDLTQYRVKILTEVLIRLLRYSEWNLLDELSTDEVFGELLQLSLRSVNTPKEVEDPNILEITCGLVKDPVTGKMATMSLDEYFEVRGAEMRLAAMHKYGLRFNQMDFKAILEQLSTAAVTVDLLGKNPASDAKILHNGIGSSRGASFILYNSARIETLLRRFDDEVRKGKYEDLPDLNQVDLSLLTKEEEWQILFGYVFAFPHLIDECLASLKKGQCSVNLIEQYLKGLASSISVYYQRIKILTDSREHLMPYIYARIYLMKAAQLVLNKALGLLNIPPMHHM
ncbi:uncharacterized protein LOC119670923 [Teleopsis dalmanni]|uniref:uncharacterized protein LOC119670923 n=1 Tax=Teleopsis dalmanni TaxID=139649 RepID=UPI0018CC93EC|nr:uncharacterized protein LOC119670923 [Teleopsis dalmanni]